jgi:hypothetical protein
VLLPSPFSLSHFLAFSLLAFSLLLQVRSDRGGDLDRKRGSCKGP